MNKKFLYVLSAVVVVGIIATATWFLRSPFPAVTNATNSVNTLVTNTNRNQNAGPSTRAVAVYFVAIDDNGQTGKKIGCGDSVVPVNQTVSFSLASSDSITTKSMRAALTALLSNYDQHYGPSSLYNALYQSRLKVDSVTMVEGRAMVALSGTIQLGGECDNPRVESQISETVRQFPEVTSTVITLNGKLLSVALSLK